MGSGLGGAGQTEPEKPSTEQTGELSGGPTQRELLQLVAILTSHCLAGLSGAGRGCCAGNIQSQEQSVAQRHQTWAKDSKEWRCSLRLRTARVSQGLYLYMELSGWLSGKVLSMTPHDIRDLGCVSSCDSAHSQRGTLSSQCAPGDQPLGGTCQGTHL